jgi:membrane-bound lytic murein transglycosylase C
MLFKRPIAILVACLTLASLPACNKVDLVRVAVSGNPERAARNMLRHRAESYATNPMLLVHDARSLRRLVDTLTGHASRQWGRRETVVPSRSRYVKYLQNYKSRALVNFDTGVIRVETVDTADPQASLHNAIVTTLLTPDDPRAVDLYSDKPVRLQGTPYLLGLVRNQQGHVIDDPKTAANFSWYLRQHDLHTRTVSEGGRIRHITYVQFSMVDNHVDLAARRYQPLVARYSRTYGVSSNLVLAIIKTESNFNPFAVSAAPAYGLMQLVPQTGGRDAYRRVHGRDAVPGPAELFNARNNIELGTAYLSLIKFSYLRGIANPVSREYCTIAAYNTGAGNVLRTFSSNRDRAVGIINGMTPAQVYGLLRGRLGSAEARRYLVKVLEARREFVSI